MNILKTPIQIEVRYYPLKGRGVCSLQTIKSGTVIERLPVLIMDPQTYSSVKQLPFINHTFVWDKHKTGELGAIGFGFASFCNHSKEPNAVIHKNYDLKLIDLVALKDIHSDEEITIKYNNTPFEIV